MQFVNSFIFGGLICVIGQILMDKFKLIPLKITILFVFFGALLELFDIYDYLLTIGYSGFLVPISSFGHTLAHAASKRAIEEGLHGLFKGIFDLPGSGISITIISAFFVSLFFKVKS